MGNWMRGEKHYFARHCGTQLFDLNENTTREVTTTNRKEKKSFIFI